MSHPGTLPGWIRRLVGRHLAGPLPGRSPRATRTACIYKVDRIGDFVLATGAIHLLRAHFGPEQCRLIVSAEVASLAGAEFPDLPPWTIPSSAAGVWREMRPLRRRLEQEWAGETFTHLICLRHASSLYRDLSLSWIPADRWHGLGPRPTAASLHAGNRPEQPREYPPATATPWSRELLAHKIILERLLGREVSWDEIRPRLNHVRPAAGSAVVFCPFGGEAIRDYPTASWLAAWRGAFPPGTEVRLLGPAGRHADLQSLATALRASGADVHVPGPMTLLEFVQQIAEARLILTVESAAAHLATALHQPAVVVTGGGHHGWFAPWGEGVRQRWVQHPLPCFGCNWDCTRPAVECLRDLPPAAVAAALRQIVSR